MVPSMDTPGVVSLSDRRRFKIVRGGGAGGGPGDFLGHGPEETNPSRLGVLLFLTSATIIFASIISAYLVRMDLGDWSSAPKPWILWLNTGLLVIASMVWQSAVGAAGRNNGPLALRQVQVAGGFILLFVIGQLAAWQNMWSMGFGVNSTPATSFFFLISAVHGLHVLGGLIVWVATLLRMRAAHEIGQLKSRIELSALYWHFLLVVWVVMFALMLLT